MVVGILGIGASLSHHTRTNQWWPSSLTQSWIAEKQKIDLGLEELANETDLPEEATLILQGLNTVKNDIFEGCEKRHIMEEQEDCVQMEIAAAKEAMAKADLKPQDIDFIISQSTLPNYLCESNGYWVHKALNLPNTCFVQGVSGMCNSFLAQLVMARSFIESGLYKTGLLLQSSGMSRLVDHQTRASTLYGDAATAMVVGKSNHGILSVATSTYTQLPPLTAIGNPGKPWYAAGKPITYEHDPSVGFNTCLWSVRQSKILTEQALQSANLSKDDITFYATNQGARWFRLATQSFIGLHHAKAYDTFSDYGGLIACNVPLSLYLAYQNKLINNDENIVMYTPGSGLQALSIVMGPSILI